VLTLPAGVIGAYLGVTEITVRGSHSRLAVADPTLGV
jgi:hypothetical protein